MTFDLACLSSPCSTSPLLQCGSYNPLCSPPTTRHVYPPESLALRAIAMASKNTPHTAWIPLPLLQVPAHTLHSCLRHRLPLLSMHVRMHTPTHSLRSFTDPFPSQDHSRVCPFSGLPSFPSHFYCLYMACSLPLSPQGVPPPV